VGIIDERNIEHKFVGQKGQL